MQEVVAWLFKDKRGGEGILEFVGLKAKMYNILKLYSETKATAKGINTVVNEEVIKHNDLQSNFLFSNVLQCLEGVWGLLNGKY